MIQVCNLIKAIRKFISSALDTYSQFHKGGAINAKMFLNILFAEIIRSVCLAHVKILMLNFVKDTYVKATNYLHLPIPLPCGDLLLVVHSFFAVHASSSWTPANAVTTESELHFYNIL